MPVDPIAADAHAVGERLGLDVVSLQLGPAALGADVLFDDRMRLFSPNWRKRRGWPVVNHGFSSAA
jgi:hypothetical protein